MRDPVFDLLDDMLTRDEVHCRGQLFPNEDAAYEHFRDDDDWHQQLDLERERRTTEALERCLNAGADLEDLRLIARECGINNWKGSV